MVTTRRAGKQQKEAEASDKSAAAAEPAKEQKPKSGSNATQEKVTLGDQHNMQRLMETAATKALEGHGYHAHDTVTYLKYACLAVASGLQIYTYFQKSNFPANWWFYFGSVLTYAALVGVAMVIQVGYERGAFLLTKPKKDSPHVGDQGMGLRVKSDMPRHTGKFKFSVRRRRHDEHLWPAKEMVLSVGEYFHEDGYLAEDKFKARVLELIKEFEKGPAKSK